MKRLLNAIPLLFVMIFALVGQAAAQPSFLPAFDPGKQIYVAPGVDSTLAQAFSSRDVVSNLQNAAAVHNLQVIVVVTASGDDAGTDARQAGPVLSRKLWDAWSRTSAFQPDRSVIVLMTGDGHTLTSVGVRAGPYLNSLGIQRNTMSDANGPVMPVLRSYLASDPASVPARIVVNINKIVTSKTTPPAPATGSGTTEGDSSMGTGTIILIVGGLFALAVLFIVITRPRRPSTTSSYTPPARTGTSLRKSGTGSGFDGRLRDSRSSRTGGAAGADFGGDDDATRRRNDDSTNTAAAVGAGVVGGMILNETLRRNDDDDRRSSSGSTDSGYVAPVATPSCSTPSSSPSCSSSSSSGSSCSSGGSSCGGGGGGGGCGGGGGM